MYSTASLDIPALATAGGRVQLPGSKSISNRVLLLAALCDGTTTVRDLLDSDDTRVMLDALKALGCSVEQTLSETRITGLGPAARPRGPTALFLGNAGTAMRPLTAALALLGGEFTLDGVARMRERPIGDLVDALRQLGCHIDYLQNDGYPPLRITHAAGAPSLNLSQPVRVRGDVSSQFLTALLMALPLAAGKQDVVIEVVGELISRPYIAITLSLLARFGVAVGNDEWQRFTIPAGSAYQSPGEIHVEADASSASYFIALGAIASSATGQKGIKIEGVGLDSIQGDIRFVDAARAMGAHITGGPNWLQVDRGTWPLKPIDLDCNYIPDAAMTLAVMALYADGTTTLRNIASWRVKETDRIAAMAAELRKLGATVDEGQDFLRITPPAMPADWRAASIHTYDDHRVAMCFALAAFNPAALPVRIEDPRCVAKTFPEFFETLFSVVQTAQTGVPVICIDGPTASGKGTIAARVAQALGYHLLDSGAIYRVAGVVARRADIEITPENEASLAALARAMRLRFDQSDVLLGSDSAAGAVKDNSTDHNFNNVTEAIRTEQAGMDASRISALPQVRTAVVDLQLNFRALPGLVADGRDMGTVIFPGAPLKVYLTASAAKRADRRHQQLLGRGMLAKIDDLRADLEARDARDMNRSAAPLKPAQDALVLDSSELTIDQAVSQVLDWWQQRQPFAQPAQG